MGTEPPATEAVTAPTPERPPGRPVADSKRSWGGEEEEGGRIPSPSQLPLITWHTLDGRGSPIGSAIGSNECLIVVEEEQEGQGGTGAFASGGSCRRRFRRVSPGQVGCLMVRGPHVSAGYVPATPSSPRARSTALACR